MTPEWMRCGSRRPFVANSLRHRRDDLRYAASQCRKAYKKDWMNVPCSYIADAYEEAAKVLDAKLVEIESANITTV